MGNAFPSFMDIAFNLVKSAGSCSREMHLCGLRALQRSIPCAFCVLSSAGCHGKDGNKESSVLL